MAPAWSRNGYEEKRLSSLRAAWLLVRVEGSQNRLKAASMLDLRIVISSDAPNTYCETPARGQQHLTLGTGFNAINNYPRLPIGDTQPREYATGMLLFVDLRGFREHRQDLRQFGKECQVGSKNERCESVNFAAQLP